MSDKQSAESDHIAELVAEAQKFDPSDDYHRRDGDLDARAYYAAVDRVVALLEGRIQKWTDPRCPLCLGHGWTGSRHDNGDYGGHYHCICGAPCAVDRAEGCTGARNA